MVTHAIITYCLVYILNDALKNLALPTIFYIVYTLLIGPNENKCLEKCHMIQIYCGITSGRVRNGELLYTNILEGNLFKFAYRLFYEFQRVPSNRRGSMGLALGKKSHYPAGNHHASHLKISNGEKSS